MPSSPSYMTWTWMYSWKLTGLSKLKLPPPQNSSKETMSLMSADEKTSGTIIHPEKHFPIFRINPTWALKMLCSRSPLSCIFLLPLYVFLRRQTQLMWSIHLGRPAAPPSICSALHRKVDSSDPFTVALPDMAGSKRDRWPSDLTPPAGMSRKSFFPVNQLHLGLFSPPMLVL